MQALSSMKNSGPKEDIKGIQKYLDSSKLVKFDYEYKANSDSKNFIAYNLVTAKIDTDIIKNDIKKCREASKDMGIIAISLKGEDFCELLDEETKPDYFNAFSGYSVYLSNCTRHESSDYVVHVSKNLETPCKILFNNKYGEEKTLLIGSKTNQIKDTTRDNHQLIYIGEYYAVLEDKSSGDVYFGYGCVLL